jgi:hypothetical protein
MARLTILYQEGIPCMDDDFPDVVFVSLRKWENTENDIHQGVSPEYILEQRVIVGGKDVTHKFSAYPYAFNSDNNLLRKAIQLYDDLLAAHPNEPTVNKVRK